MKDKEMIEEMAKEISKTWLVDLEGNTQDVCEVLDRVDIESIAKELYEQGYRKLPKDSVVLTREELQENYVSKTLYEQLQKVSLARKEQIDKLSKKLIEARKETAEKFVKKVKKLLKKVDIIVDGDEGLVGYEESAVDKGLTELAKQFGVEIKE